MNKEIYCKFPQHFICQMAGEGHLKSISLLSSLKVMFPDGFIKNFRKVDLNALGYRISKKTYYNYLKKLERLKFIKSNGKGGCFLIGQKQILELYPHNRPKYIYLENNQELRNNFEFIALAKNIENQQLKQKQHLLKANAKRKFKSEEVIKRVNGEKVVCVTPLEFETSISCQKQAEIIGYRSPMTGLKRRRKLVAKGYIQTNKRCIRLGNLSRDIVEEYRNFNKWILKCVNGIWYRILANEVFILQKIGVKSNYQSLW